MGSLELNKNDVIASGRERDCYIHPLDHMKIIKVMKDNINNANQNRVDEVYYNLLNKKKLSFSNIAKYFGSVDTNLGKGLVFERVLNYDGTTCKSFRYVMSYKLVSLEEQKYLISSLKKYLFENQILFADSSLTNILYKKTSENNSKLVIIDGLGAKRMGLKFSLYRTLSLYKKYKMYKQWNKFISAYKADLKRIENPLDKPITRF